MHHDLFYESNLLFGCVIDENKIQIGKSVDTTVEKDVRIDTTFEKRGEIETSRLSR